MSVYDAVWDIVEDEADYKFYVKQRGRPIAEKPAFLILGKNNFFSPWKGKYALIMNHVALIGLYNTREECFNKIREAVRKSNVQLELYIQTRRSRKLKLFTRNYKGVNSSG